MLIIKCEYVIFCMKLPWYQFAPHTLSANLCSWQPRPSCFVDKYLHFKVCSTYFFDESSFFISSMLRKRFFPNEWRSLGSQRFVDEGAKTFEGDRSSANRSSLRRAKLRHEDSLTKDEGQSLKSSEQIDTKGVS